VPHPLPFKGAVFDFSGFDFSGFDFSGFDFPPSPNSQRSPPHPGRVAKRLDEFRSREIQAQK